MSLLTINDIVQENDLSTMLDKHRRQMINIAKHKKIERGNAKKLENFLNNTFFNNKDKTKINSINNRLRADYENIQNKTLKEDFSITDSTYELEIKDISKMIREKYETFSHTKKIYLSVLQARRDKVETFISTLTSKMNEITDGEKILAQANELKTSLEDIITKTTSILKTDKKGKYIDIENLSKDLESEDLKILINTADQLYKTLSICPITPKDYGDILEKALSFLNVEANEIGEEIAEQLAEDYIYGNKKIKEGNIDFTPNKKLLESDKTKKSSDSKDSQENEEYEYKINDSFSFKYSKTFNPYKKRQMKMDVLLNIPDESSQSSQFRVSAKNWSSTAGQDFGTSNLIYTLIRSAGEDYAQRYGYILSYKKNNNSSILLNAAHRLAKISIVLDILMGFSQRGVQNGYADTLVILDRTGKKFQVESISEIIGLINRGIDNFNIMDYKGEDLANKAKIIRDTVLYKQKNNRSRTLQSMLYKYFASIQINLRYSDIFKNSKII